jgi:hypothetical protein
MPPRITNADSGQVRRQGILDGRFGKKAKRGRHDFAEFHAICNLARKTPA